MLEIREESLKKEEYLQQYQGGIQERNSRRISRTAGRASGKISKRIPGRFPIRIVEEIHEKKMAASVLQGILSGIPRDSEIPNSNSEINPRKNSGWVSEGF